MPNNNPAGVNQPLNQHPLPSNKGYALAGDGAMASNIAIASGDILLVPPPSAGGRRQVSFTGVVAYLSNTAGIATLNADLIYKDANGDEVLVGQASVALAAAGSDVASLGPSVGGLILMPEDQGLFARVTADPASGVAAVSANWLDVRNVERYDVNLTTVYQTLFANNDYGICRFFSGWDQEADGFPVVLNKDTAAVVIDIRLTDGTTTIDLPPISTPAGEIDQPLGVPVVLPPGWTIEARLQAALTANPCTIVCAVSKTNQAPARQNQGGAY